MMGGKLSDSGGRLLFGENLHGGWLRPMPVVGGVRCSAAGAAAVKLFGLNNGLLASGII